MMQDEIIKWQKTFQFLQKWSIKYNPNDSEKCKCFHNSKRYAEIYEWENKYEPVQPNDYVLHEILHICIREIEISKKENYKLGREVEEQFVQCVCDITKGRYVTPPAQ